MVRTRSSGSNLQSDPNRIIAVVTGANSGFGLGICQQLLSNLSLPAGVTPPGAIPTRSALAPSQVDLLESTGGPFTESPDNQPWTLTLILGCRSSKNAEHAKKVLMRRHEKELAKRARRQQPVRAGWVEGLKIVWEGVDCDAVGGKHGILAFCERLKGTYPHITSLFLNAGIGAYSGNNYLGFCQQVWTDGFIRTVSFPRYNIERKGATSSDGERGMVWGINVFAPYIMAKELTPLLRRSPKSLPVSPRLVYTGSINAKFDRLKPEPLNDYQLLTYANQEGNGNYPASKYMGELVMVQLDRELSASGTEKEPTVRCLNADAGCVTTNIFNEGFGQWRVLTTALWALYWLVFYLARLFGSRRHPVYASEGALAMIYSALVEDKYLMPAKKVPAQKFEIISTRWGRNHIGYNEVDRWEEGEAIGEGMVKACEAMRIEWRRREGLE